MKRPLFVIPVFFALLPATARAQAGDAAKPANDVQNYTDDIEKDRQDVKRDVRDIRIDEEKLKATDASQKDALKDLDAKQEAAVAPIRDDPSLSAMDKKTKLADILKDYKAQRKALKDKFSDQRKKIEKDERRDRAEAREARREARQDKRDREIKR